MDPAGRLARTDLGAVPVERFEHAAAVAALHPLSVVGVVAVLDTDESALRVAHRDGPRLPIFVPADAQPLE
jgi:hypothetical protein